MTCNYVEITERSQIWAEKKFEQPIWAVKSVLNLLNDIHNQNCQSSGIEKLLFSNKD